jgi:transcriptional regulator with XRE-family HTH domain
VGGIDVHTTLRSCYKCTHLLCRAQCVANHGKLKLSIGFDERKNAVATGSEEWREFGVWLRSTRLAKEISSASDFASKVGIDASQLSRIENGSSTSQKTLLGIARALGLPPDEVIGRAPAHERSRDRSEYIVSLASGGRFDDKMQEHKAAKEIVARFIVDKLLFSDDTPPRLTVVDGTSTACVARVALNRFQSYFADGILGISTNNIHVILECLQALHSGQSWLDLCVLPGKYSMRDRALRGEDTCRAIEEDDQPGAILLAVSRLDAEQGPYGTDPKARQIKLSCMKSFLTAVSSSETDERQQGGTTGTTRSENILKDPAGGRSRPKLIIALDASKMRADRPDDKQIPASQEDWKRLLERPKDVHVVTDLHPVVQEGLDLTPEDWAKEYAEAANNGDLVAQHRCASTLRLKLGDNLHIVTRGD